jgi:hypothetical protein
MVAATYELILTDGSIRNISALIDMDMHTSAYLRSYMSELLAKAKRLPPGTAVQEIWCME